MPGFFRRTAAAAALTVAAAMLVGCAEPSPEKQLVDAGEALGEATEELGNLDAQIEQTTARLERLRSDRRKQRNRVRTLEQRLEARATDVAVFRAVQIALLNDEQLQDAAIAVDVEDGVVTLTGVVRSRGEAARAIAVSQQTAGVDSVASRVRVDDPKDGGDNRT